MGKKIFQKTKCKRCNYKLYIHDSKENEICSDCLESDVKKVIDPRRVNKEISDAYKSTIYITQDCVMQVCADCLGVGETQYWANIKICKNCKGTGMIMLNRVQNNRKKTFTFIKK